MVQCMNDRKAFDRLTAYIMNESWETMSPEVREQARKCFADLAGVICCGAKNLTAKKAAGYVAENYPKGDITVLSTGEKSNLIGAALANGMAANALDLDDGYSLLRGHPGAGFFGALLCAAEKADCTYGELLAALTVAFETSIREGYTIRDYYGWDHSSGSYATFATAAACGKLLHLSKKELENALCIADFILPVVPAKRSTYYPSTNKDGIYWGQHAGMQAIVMAQSGITGDNPVILDEKYIPYIDTLGEKYYMFDLYIKFVSCCRWAHSPIRAVAAVMKENGISAEDIAKIDIYSFGNAGTLYRKAPTCEDEAQYNIIYPIAAQVVFGDCTPLESSTDRMLDPRIAPMIEKIEFHHDPEYDKVFPGKRLSRAEITCKDGRHFASGAMEPLGDRNADVSIEDIFNKIRKFDGIYNEPELVEKLIDAIKNTAPEEPFSKIYSIMKEMAATNKRPKLRFI